VGFVFFHDMKNIFARNVPIFFEHNEESCGFHFFQSDLLVDQVNAPLDNFFPQVIVDGAAVVQSAKKPLRRGSEGEALFRVHDAYRASSPSDQFALTSTHIKAELLNPREYIVDFFLKKSSARQE
jgi:hypothetical protein